MLTDLPSWYWGLFGRIKAKWSKPEFPSTVFVFQWPSKNRICNWLCFTIFTRPHMAAMCVCSSHVIITRFITRSRDHYVARGTMAVFSDFVSFLLLLDCQEAFHCCLVVACINRINMISIECHRVGEWWPGKQEVDNRIESGQGKSCAYYL